MSTSPERASWPPTTMTSGLSEVDQTGRGHADVPAGVREDPPAARVALGGADQHVAQGELTVGGRQGAQQCAATRRRCPGSHGCRTGRWAVLVDGQMADLPRRSRAPPEQLATQDQAGAHAVRRLDVAAGPAPRVARRIAAPPTRQVRGVVQPDRGAQARLHRLRDRDAAPPGQDRLGPHLARSPCRPGQAARTPTAERSPMRAPARSTMSASSRAARSMPSSAWWSAGRGIRCWPSTCIPPSLTATRTSRSPNAMPARSPRGPRARPAPPCGRCACWGPARAAARRPARGPGSRPSPRTGRWRRPARPGSSPPGPAPPAPDASGWRPGARSGTPEPAVLRSQVVTYSPFWAPR